MSEKKGKIYEFGGFRLDPSEGILSKEEVAVRLTPKAFATLVLLVENQGQLVDKAKLMETVWHGSFVEESAVSWCIWSIRNAIGDDSKAQDFIQTVPKRGYRFVGAVNEITRNRQNGDAPPHRPELLNGSVSNVDLAGTVQVPTDVPSVAAISATATHENSTDRSKQPAIPKNRHVRLEYLAIGILGFAFLSVVSLYSLSQMRSSSESSPTPVHANAPVLNLNAAFTATRLSLSDNTVHAKLSPDGTKVIYSKGLGNEPESIWLRDLESKNNLEILSAGDVNYGGLKFGPDDGFVYFARRPKTVPLPAFDIYRAPTAGGVPFKITGGTEGWIDVSDDGNLISFVRCERDENDFCSLWVADAKTGANERKIVSKPKPIGISAHSISPDGKRIAFAVGQSHTGSNDFSLAVVDIDSGREEIFADRRFFNIRSLVWSPDSASIFAAAAKSPNIKYDLWEITSGSELQVTQDAESYNQISVSRDKHKFLATTVREDFRLKIGSIDSPHRFRPISPAMYAVFAADQRIVFSSPKSGNNAIWSIDRDNSNLRQLTNAESQDRHPYVPDDSRYIFFSSNRSGVMDIWRMNLDGSEQVKITDANGGFPLRLSQDNEWLFYHHAIHRTLYRVQVNGGEPEPVLDTRAAEFAIAPDATKVAHFAVGSNELVVSSLADAKEKRSFNFGAGWAEIIDIAWDAAQDSFNLVAKEPKRKTHTLWQINLDGSDPKFLLDLGPEPIADFRVSPDAKEILYTQGSWRHDILLLDRRQKPER